MPELWSMKKLCEYFQISRQSIYRRIREGKIPKPIQQKVVGSPRWNAEEIKKSIKGSVIAAPAQHRKLGKTTRVTSYGDNEKCEVDLLLDAIGLPSLEYSGVTVKEMRSPIVYAWISDGKVLYVGRSFAGLARPFSSDHHRLMDIQDRDKLLIWYISTIEHAVKVEIDLIHRFHPVYNSPHLPRRIVVNEGIISN